MATPGARAASRARRCSIAASWSGCTRIRSDADVRPACRQRLGGDLGQHACVQGDGAPDDLLGHLAGQRDRRRRHRRQRASGLGARLGQKARSLDRSLRAPVGMARRETVTPGLLEQGSGVGARGLVGARGGRRRRGGRFDDPTHRRSIPGRGGQRQQAAPEHGRQPLRHGQRTLPTFA